jgi:hypothetical protein
MDQHPNRPVHHRAPLQKPPHGERSAQAGRIEKGVLNRYAHEPNEPTFEQHFVQAMAIPHKTAAFTNLMKDVTPPPVEEVVMAGSGGGDGGATSRWVWSTWISLR